MIVTLSMIIMIMLMGKGKKETDHDGNSDDDNYVSALQKVRLLSKETCAMANVHRLTKLSTLY